MGRDQKETMNVLENGSSLVWMWRQGQRTNECRFLGMAKGTLRFRASVISQFKKMNGEDKDS